MSMLAIASGVYLVLEGMQVTSFGKPSGNTPYWLITTAGVVFVVAGVSVLMGNTGKWNDLAAAIMTGLMGAIAGWISLFSDDSAISGNAMFISELTGIPIHRIAFALGSLISFMVCIYALRCFYKKI